MKKLVEPLLAALVVGLAAVLIWVLRESGPAPTTSDDRGAAAAPTPTLPAEAVESEPVQDEVHASLEEMDSLLGVDWRWVERNNQATSLLAEGDLAGAVELFEKCYEAFPERVVFRRNFAEALIRLARAEYQESGGLPEALVHIERAVELAPDRDDIDTLRKILGRWRDENELSLRHLTEVSLYFEFSYDAARTDILANSQGAIVLLDDSYVGMAAWFGFDPVLHGGRDKFRVILYDRAGFDRVTGIGDWAGGVFDGTIRVSVEKFRPDRARWGRVLRHELVHAFIHEVGGDAVPGWLNEGLAQYLDTSCDWTDDFRRESVQLAREALRGETLFSLEELAGSLARWTDRAAITKAYAESLVVVDYIAHQWGEDALRAMLAGAKQGEGADAAFQRWSGGESLADMLELVRRDLER